MLLHLGSDIAVQTACIIAILDKKSFEHNVMNKKFFENMKENYGIRSVTEDEIKSYVIYQKDEKISIFGSHISSTTLMKRAAKFEL